MPESESDAGGPGEEPRWTAEQRASSIRCRGTLLLLGNHGVPTSRPVLLDSGCCSVIYTGELEQETLIFDSSEDRKSEIKVPASGLVRALFWVTLFPHVVEVALVSFLIRTLVSSRRPHF